jgi:hypothetical protein
VSARVAAAFVVLALRADAGANPSLSVEPTANAGALKLDDLRFTHVVKVARITVTADSSRGATISLASGALHALRSRTDIPFQVALAATGTSPPSSSAFTTPSAGTYQAVLATAGRFERDLYIRYTACAPCPPGDYTATIDAFVVDN